jgi:hypothetical protein
MAAMNCRPSEWDLRCHCGSLMARVTVQGIELKCRRCKRVVVLAADQVRDRWVVVTVHDDEAMSL